MPVFYRFSNSFLTVWKNFKPDYLSKLGQMSGGGVSLSKIRFTEELPGIFVFDGLDELPLRYADFDTFFWLYFVEYDKVAKLRF